jgi:hypothetical protein
MTEESLKNSSQFKLLSFGSFSCKILQKCFTGSLSQWSENSEFSEDFKVSGVFDELGSKELIIKETAFTIDSRMEDSEEFRRTVEIRKSKMERE